MRLKFILLIALAAIALPMALAQTSLYFACYDSCPSNTSAVGCEIYVNNALVVDVGTNTNFTFYQTINDSANNQYEELICYYSSGAVSLAGGGPRITPPVSPNPPVPPPQPNPVPQPRPQPPLPVPVGGPQPPAGGAAESIATGTSSGSGQYYTCTKDCPPAQPGYVLIGCTITVDHAVSHTEGRAVPSGSGSNGYVHISSHTDKDANGNVVYDEILACEYWKIGLPLPPSFEELVEQELQNMEGERIKQVTSMYNNQMAGLPNFAKGFLGNENLHLYFTDDAGATSEYAAVTETGGITEIENWMDLNNNRNQDSWEERGIKPTMAVYVDQQTLTEIWQAEDSVAAFKEAWGNEIKYEGLTFGSKFKEFFMGIGLWFADVFS